MRRQSPPRGFLGLGRGVSIGLFLVGFLLTCASAASAYWSIPVQFAPTNHALAEAGTLKAPLDPTATANGSSAITVAWTSPAGQPVGATYSVARMGSPVVVVCANATTSCQDEGEDTGGLVAGTTYEYSVTAVIGDHWQSPAVSASATTLGVETTSLPPASVGKAYAFALSAVGGSGEYTWALAPGSPALPSWADLNAATGEITGTPDGVGTTPGLIFTVTDSLGGTATSGPFVLTVAQGSTSTAVLPSMDTVTFGAESEVDFVVTVQTANNAAVTNGLVTVSVGEAGCTVTLPANSCSIGNTALWAGGPYAVSATFVGDADLASSTGSASSGVTVAPDSATVAFTVSSSSVVYGAETGLEFDVVVTGENADIPDGDSVSVATGSTELCVITVAGGGGSCSPASGTVLPSGDHDVTATFTSSGPNFVASDSPMVTVTVSPDVATFQSFTVSSGSAVFGTETSLVFSAQVAGSNVVLPEGDVTVVAGSTPLCTITLSSGVGSCSPVSDTVLPIGIHAVTATFTNPNFTTASSTTSVTISPSPLAGIRWASVSTTGTFTCVETNPQAVTCTATGVGNRGSFQANVQLVDANGDPFTTGSAITVSQTTTGVGGTTTPTGSLTIAQSTSTTAGTYKLTLKPGNQPTTTITASINVGGTTYTVNCAVSR